MTREYTVENNGIIWYEENGIRVSFMADPANSDYQRYLKWLEDPTAEDQPIGGNK